MLSQRPVGRSVGTAAVKPTIHPTKRVTQEWNASSYHKVSAPQTSWGQKVLARLELRGDERAIDAGCGSGRLTGELLERLPHGQLVAIDRSWNMLQTARANLRPAFGPRVRFVQVSLPAMPFDEWADLIFSTATFHWVGDHPALFANLFKALRPGGRLHAQCGGGANLAEAHALADQVMQRPAFAEYFTGWPGPWLFATDIETRARLLASRLHRCSNRSGARAHYARQRSGLPRVRHDRDLPSAPFPPPRVAQGSIHR